MVLLSFGGGVWSWGKSEKSMGSGVAGGVPGRSPRSASSLVLSAGGSAICKILNEEHINKNKTYKLYILIIIYVLIIYKLYSPI